MTEVPRSLIAFQRQFPDEDACARYLYTVRWPDGFRCPGCGHDRSWQLRTKPWTFECHACHRQTSVTAGTVMHGSKLSLPVWFWAAYLMATHSNGISAKQLQHQVELGSYKSAWLLCAKLRRAMVDPDRHLLGGIVEADETSVPFRTKTDPPTGGQGRSRDGKLLIGGAVERINEGPGRLRLAALADYSAASLHGFVKANVAADSVLHTDGWRGYSGMPDVVHEPHVVGPMAAHLVLHWTHTVFANLKTWALGVYHGLRAKHLQAYLDEFVFRFNRRRSRHAAFLSLLRIGTRIKPVTYDMLIAPEPEG